MADIKGIRDVAERHLCTGCGACAYVQPEVIRIVDDLDQGRRPIVADGADTSEALRACPGQQLIHDYDSEQEGLIQELEEDWGPVLGLWDGYATDPEVRWSGSSGGAATALALFAMEQKGFHGTLHIAARQDHAWLNETVLSRSRDEMLAATGSRYAPASPCDGLGMVEEADGPCVVIGKPCDVAGANMAARLRPELQERLGLTIGIFCAGTPSTAGTLEMLAEMGFPDPEQVTHLRYRGEGWPGNATATGTDAGGAPRVAKLTYEQSWGRILNRHRPWRCYVCADHTGEFADISVGDPWYHEIPEDAPGRSLVLARTARGRRFIEAAIAAGVLTLDPAEPRALLEAQPNLLTTRGAVWGRAWATRILGVSAPKLTGLRTRGAWRRSLGWKARLQSFYGTWKRVFTRRLYRRRPVVPLELESVIPVPEVARRDEGEPS